MTPSTIDDLFRRWASLDHHKGHRFIKDGVIDPNRWENIEVRTLFLLKEAYDWDDTLERYDVAASIFDDQRPTGPSQRLAALWAYVIRQIHEGGLPTFPDGGPDNPTVTEAFMCSAIVNIKKSQGQKTSDGEDLAVYAERDSVLIQEQIELLDPHIIICGNVWKETANTVFSRSNPIYDRVHKWRGRHVVDFWHPGNRFPHKMNYYALGSLIQNGIPKPYSRC